MGFVMKMSTLLAGAKPHLVSGNFILHADVLPLQLVHLCTLGCDQAMSIVHRSPTSSLLLSDTTLPDIELIRGHVEVKV